MNSIFARFINPQQLSVIQSGMRGEEGDFFKAKMEELHQTFTTMPETYGQDGKGDSAVVYLHYFFGGSDWWIIERDKETEQEQAFGYACLGGDVEMAELGYISIAELIECGVELDLYWEPKTLGEVKKGLTL